MIQAGVTKPLGFKRSASERERGPDRHLWWAGRSKRLRPRRHAPRGVVLARERGRRSARDPVATNGRPLGARARRLMSPGPTLCGSASPIRKSCEPPSRPRSPASGDYPPAMDRHGPPCASMSGSPACRVAGRADLPEPPGGSLPPSEHIAAERRSRLRGGRLTRPSMSQDATDHTRGARGGDCIWRSA